MASIIPNPCSQPKIWQDANCHCRAISYRIHLPSLTDPVEPKKVVSCDCSLCTKNGVRLVYPKRSEVLVKSPGKQGEASAGSKEMREALKDVLGYYIRSDGNGEMENVFCKICGSTMWSDARGGEEVGRRLDPADEEWKDVLSLNALMIKGIYADKLTVTYDVWRDSEPKYE